MKSVPSIRRRSLKLWPRDKRLVPRSRKPCVIRRHDAYQHEVSQIGGHSPAGKNLLDCCRGVSWSHRSNECSETRIWLRIRIFLWLTCGHSYARILWALKLVLHVYFWMCLLQNPALRSKDGQDKRMQHFWFQKLSVRKGSGLAEKEGPIDANVKCTSFDLKGVLTLMRS